MIGYFKCRPCRNAAVGSYIAWGGYKPLTADEATREPQEPVFFDFGKTEAAAIANLKACTPEVTDWRRQEIK